MSHHSQCNLSFHGWTCSPWILIADRRQKKSRQLSMIYWTHSKLVSHNDDTHDVVVIPNATFCLLLSFKACWAMNALRLELVFGHAVDRRQEKSRQLSIFYWTHSKLVSHNDATHDVLVIPNAPFCLLVLLMMFSSFQMQRFVFRCHSQHAELWTPCDLNSCLDMPEFVIRLRRTSDARKMLPSSDMSHHSQCNLSFHGWTCSSWILLVDRRQKKSRQLSMFH